jgi:DNA polymerase V
VLADKSVKPKPGDKVAFQIDDFPQLGRLFRTGIITLEGETIDGECLDGIIILGKVTSEVISVHENSRPII